MDHLKVHSRVKPSPYARPPPALVIVPRPLGQVNLAPDRRTTGTVGDLRDLGVERQKSAGCNGTLSNLSGAVRQLGCIFLFGDSSCKLLYHADTDTVAVSESGK